RSLPRKVGYPHGLAEDQPEPLGHPVQHMDTALVNAIETESVRRAVAEFADAVLREDRVQEDVEKAGNRLIGTLVRQNVTGENARDFVRRMEMVLSGQNVA